MHAQIAYFQLPLCAEKCLRSTIKSTKKGTSAEQKVVLLREKKRSCKVLSVLTSPPFLKERFIAKITNPNKVRSQAI